MKNYKKILIVSSEFPPQPGGIGNHAFNLASQLSTYKYKVTVLTDVRSKKGAQEKQFDVECNFNVIRIPRYSFILITYLKRVLAYRNYLKKNKPTIVMASGKFSLWLVAFGFSTKNLRKLAVVHGSEVNLKINWQHQLVDSALKRFDTVIPVSTYTKSLLRNLALHHMEVIPNGFDKLKFEFKKKDEFVELVGNPKLLTVGAVSERKGQHNVIEKLPDLIKVYPELQYHMVGIPSEKEKLLQLATVLDVENHMTFHGQVNQLELNKILNSSDVFVMLSEQGVNGAVEGFGIALLEANYIGLPTIGSKNCGIEDAIKNNYSGVLIDPKNSAAFEDALEEIFDNKTAYVDNAKTWALKHTWESVIIQYLKLFI